MFRRLREVERRPAESRPRYPMGGESRSRSAHERERPSAVCPPVRSRSRPSGNSERGRGDVNVPYTEEFGIPESFRKYWRSVFDKRLGIAGEVEKEAV